MTEQLLQATDANTKPEGQAAQATESSERTVAPEQQSPQQDGQQSDESTAKGAEPEVKAEAEAEEKPPREGAPERYEFADPKGLPEGKTLDRGFLANFEKLAREVDLSQGDAQKLLELVPTLWEKHQADQVKQANAWLEETRKHPYMTGGDGFDANLRSAKQAIAEFGDESLDELFAAFPGAANHKGLVSLLAKVGKALKPDGFVGSDRGREGPPNTDAAIAERMFPKTISQMKGKSA